MNFEKNRLKTFLNWPKNAPVSPDKIARAGFYYTGHDLTVQCHFCNKTISEWSYSDQVMLKHKNLNPNCSFVLNPLISENVVYNKAQNYSTKNNINYEITSRDRKYEISIMNDGINRIRSYMKDAIFLSVKMYLLSVNGFYATGDGDNIKCINCSFNLKNWIGKIDPIAEHCLCKKNCPMIKEIYLNSGDEFFVQKSCEVYAHEFIEFKKRLESFINWPHEYPDPKSLSFAGLYFTKENDFVRCFYCDIGLRQWLQTDNPLVEHARSSPTCEFMILLTSKSFIELCLQCLTNSNDCNTNVNKLEAEIRDLKESKLCKICLDEDIAIAFVPCGHLLTCQNCAVSLTHCPLCRGPVSSTVRTYMS